MRNGGLWVLGGAFMSAFLWTSAASAQNIALEIQYCNDDMAEAARRIEACTAVIDSERTPDTVPFFLTRGFLLMQEGRSDDARADFDLLLVNHPDDFDMLFAVAVTIQASGNPALSLPYYDQAIARHPYEASSFNNKAWLLATATDAAVRNGEEAVAAALQAVALEDSATYRDTLAAAYAEQGDFDRAVEEQQKAIDMLGANMPPAVMRDMEARLELFRQGQPYRE